MKSRPEKATFALGLNYCSDECGENYGLIVGPAFKDISGVKAVRERGEISLPVFNGPSVDVKVGDAVEVIPAHFDTTVKLHSVYYGIRDGVVEVVWRNYGQCLF